MVKMQCQYCNSVFSTKSSLNNHLKNAKYCLEKRGLINSNFICEYCSQSFTSNFMLKNHLVNCATKPVAVKLKSVLDNRDEIIRKLEGEKFRLKNLIKIQKITIDNHQNTIETQKNLLEKYEHHINDLTSKVVPRGTGINTKLTEVKAHLEKVHSIDFSPDKILQVVKNLTFKDTCDRAAGIARFIRKNFLEDDQGNLLYICSSVSRRIFRYKNNSGNIITDPRCTALFDIIFEPLVNGIRVIYNGLLTSEKMCEEMSENLIKNQDYFVSSTNFRPELIGCICGNTILKTNSSKNQAKIWKDNIQIESSISDPILSDNSDDSDDGYFAIDEISKMTCE